MANTSFARRVTKIFEGIGVLNKGSGEKSRPETGEASPVAIETNALNVTRVGGLAAAISGTGAAALALFQSDEKSDAIVVASYAATALIVAAALIAAAVIISADIRSRTVAATTGDSATSTKPEDLEKAWRRAAARLGGAIAGLESGNRPPVAAWLDASASTGLVADLTPPEGLADEHARLSVARDRIIERLKALVDSTDAALRRATLVEAEAILAEMERTLEELAS